MKCATLWEASVVTAAEAEDAVAEALARLLGTAASSHTDLRTGRIKVSVFVETDPRRQPGLDENWRRSTSEMTRCGLNPGKARLHIQKIRRENWAESWKRHFKPLNIGNALLLKPSWSNRKAKPGQAVVVLDPGLSFGTGQHPTTAFCLRQLVRAREHRRSFLDVGTGSGLLAIAAARLGYAPVHAFDIDPESVRVARANARANGVERQLRITRADLTRLPARGARRYDLVCANLISTLLLAERQKLRQRLKPGGLLVVAGILAAEFAIVRRAFDSLDLRLVARRREQEWTSATFMAPQMERA